MSTRKRDPWKRLLAKLKNSAKCHYRAGSRFHDKKVITVTAADLAKQFQRQKGRCFWLGIKIDPMTIYESWNHLSPSLDRIDSKKDYTAENVVITTRFANLGRGRLTVEQFTPQIKKIRDMLYRELWPVYPCEHLTISTENPNLEEQTVCLTDSPQPTTTKTTPGISQPTSPVT